MIDTPRTDEEEDGCRECGIHFVNTEFAHTLERELSAARAEIERLREESKAAYQLTAALLSVVEDSEQRIKRSDVLDCVYSWRIAIDTARKDRT